MNRTLRIGLSVCLSIWLVGSIGVWGVSAQDAPPVILVVDTSSSEAADVYNAVDSVVSFITAYNPISLVSTCSPAAITEATQDAEALHAILSSVADCDAFDQAEAVQQAVTQLNAQPGTIIYIVDGQNVSAGSTLSSAPMKAALAELKDHTNCLYVIPIGDASLPSTDANSIDSGAVSKLVNGAGCGTSYDAQQPNTVASLLLQAYLDSQHRELFTNGEQLALFSRSKAKLSQDIALGDDVDSVRVDVVWGEGELDVVLEPPPGATIEPSLISGDGYQSLVIDNPPAGDWNVTLSVTRVPKDQVGVVLFSQSKVNAPNRSQALSGPEATAEASETAAAETVAQDTTQTNALPMIAVIAGVVALIAVGIGSGVILWRRRRSRNTSGFFDSPAPSGNTLHSRTTAELPRVDPAFLALNHDGYNQTLPTEPLQKVVITPPVQNEQFNQFPAKVVFVSGIQQGQFVNIDSGYFTIGRHSANRLRIQDVSVSREHAHILFDNANNLYVIENMSQAGTQVNGQRITQPRPLYNGDVIQVGTIQMQFQLRIPG